MPPTRGAGFGVPNTPGTGHVPTFSETRQSVPGRIFAAERGTTVEAVTSASMTVTLTGNTIVGNTLVLFVGGRGSFNVSSVTDTRSNTWTVDLNAPDVGANHLFGICRAPVTAQLVAGDVVTINFSGSVGPNREAILEEFTGILTASPVDQTASAAATTATPSSGTTAATTQDNELLVAAYLSQIVGTAAWSLAPGWLGFPTSELHTVGAASTDRSLHAEYRIVAQQGAQSATTRVWGGPGGPFPVTSGIVAYKLAAVGATTNTDAPTGTLTESGSLTEAKQYTETASGTVTLSGTFTEAKKYIDAASGTVTLSGSLVEARTTSDTSSGSETLSGSLSDAKRYTDSPSGTLTLSGSSSDAKRFTDSASGSVTLSGSTSEADTQSEGLTGTLTLSGTRTEANTHTGAQSGTETLTGTLTDATTFTDAPAGTLALSGTAADQHTTTDAPTGALTLAGTAAETDYQTESLTGTLVLSGSLDETFTGTVFYTDAPTGTLTLTGSIVDGIVYTDSPVGVIGGEVIVTPPRPAPTVAVGGGIPITLERRFHTYSDNVYGSLRLTGRVAEAYTTTPPTAPIVTTPLPNPADDPLPDPDVVYETTFVNRPIRIVPYYLYPDVPNGVLTLAGSVTTRWQAPPPPNVAAEEDPDPESLFELLGL
jgi:fibronectin-binding autotransporter adhesin